MDIEEGEAGGSQVALEHAIDAVSEGDKDVAEKATGEVEDEIQGEPDDDDEADDDEDDDDDEEYAFRFKIGTNPLDFVGDDSSGVQLYEQFERLEYEALAEKKRKALADSQGERLAKKARQDDIPEAAMDVIMEAMNCGSRRKLRRPKKRGRRKGSKNKLSPEISRMLGNATLHYAHGRYKEAISVLNEVVRLAPNLPDSYNMLGLVYKALGNHKIAFEFYMLAGLLKPKDSSLWKLLLSWSMEQGNVSQTCYCLSKAITADPKDISLRFYQASLYADLGDYKKAAESYEQIQQLSPENVEALTSGAKLYLKCGQVEHAIDILEEYLKSHPCEADLSVVELLVAILMEINSYERALKQIEHARTINYSGKELPLKLKAKSGICYLHLGNMEKAEILYDVLQVGRAHDHKDLIAEVADSFMSLGYFSSALKFYHTLEIDDGLEKGNLHLRIAQCYLSLKERVKAKDFFYKALHGLKDNIEVRLTLATLLLEDAKEDEALPLVSPPENLDDVNLNSDKSKQWWVDPKIKFKLCQIYRAKGMTKEFVDTILPLVHESLLVENYWRRHKIRVKRRLTESVLNQRVKKVDCLQSDGVIRGSISSATPSDRLKASRAKKLLQKKAALKEEKKAAAKAAGLDWHSDNDNENDEPEEEQPKEAPLPNLLKDEEHRCLIKDLCKALASLQRYYEALEIIQLTLKLCQNTLPAEVEEFRSLGAQMAYSTMDPKLGFEYVKHIVLKHPYSFAAWNCYYNVVSRFLSHPKWGKIYSKFLRHMRGKCKDSVPATLIAGHQFTMGSLHQDAAREYLDAYKKLPENPLINLCVGTALINLTLGFRLKNKHQTIAQGLAFLYNNLRLCENSQEALYNIARACHHVGLVTLAASYYEKVLQTPEKDHPIPKLPSESWDVSENQLQHGYCDLRREAAFNLHLIYKKSGAVDLARQILKDHCTI